MSSIYKIALVFLLYFHCFLGNAENPISYTNINLSHVQSYEELGNIGFKPRADVPPWPLVFPMNWSADPFTDLNWIFQLQAWRSVDPIILKYIATNNPQYLKETFSVMLDWYTFNVIQKKKPKYQWDGMATGIRAMKLAWLYGEISGALSLNEQQILLKLMQLHVTSLLKETSLNKNNHAFFQLVGLKLLCISESKLKGCEKEMTFNLEHMSALFQSQFDEFGVHKENSPSYFYFVITLIERLNIANLYNIDVMRFIDKANQVLPWLRYPDNMVIRKGDSDGFYRRDSEITQIPQKINGVDVLIGNFINSGYFTVRTSLDIALNNSAQIFITGMSNAKAGHYHEDELSFELFYNGELVFVDSGKYSYDPTPLRNYVVSANAHNTLSLEKPEILPKEKINAPSALLSYTVNDDEIKIFGVFTRDKYYTHAREFSINPFVNLKILDRFNAEKKLLQEVAKTGSKIIFSSNLHINPKYSVENISENEVNVGGFVRVKLISDVCILKVVYGQKNPLLGWVSFSYNKIEPSFVLQASCEVEEKGSLTWDIVMT